MTLRHRGPFDPERGPSRHTAGRRRSCVQVADRPAQRRGPSTPPQKALSGGTPPSNWRLDRRQHTLKIQFCYLLTLWKCTLNIELDVMNFQVKMQYTARCRYLEDADDTEGSERHPESVRATTQKAAWCRVLAFVGATTLTEGGELRLAGCGEHRRPVAASSAPGRWRRGCLVAEVHAVRCKEKKYHSIRSFHGAWGLAPKISAPVGWVFF
jgi:hypothetical protein